MKLSEIFAKTGVEGRLTGDADIARIVQDSRNIRPGDIFLAYPNALSFLDQAKEKGAFAAILPLGTQQNVFEISLELVDYEASLWRICKELYSDPGAAMRLVGVTGTNGKTTTAWIIRDLLSALGNEAGYLGTLGFQTPHRQLEIANTTPFISDFYNLMTTAISDGVEAMGLEVSSHALAQKRVDGTTFEVAVFTNLTQDHLDFHGTMENYEGAKWRLFTDFGAEVGCFNTDDPVGARWAEKFEGRAIRFGTTASADLQIVEPKVQVDRASFFLKTSDEAVEINTRLGGMYNVWNMTAAVAAVHGMGYSLSEIANKTEFAKPVPGRFEPVANQHGFGVIVDYAHTDDALEKLLVTARELTLGRLITVFGCGGDRDRTKRPKMAAIAARLSDEVIVTSDNPRTEDPEEILREVTQNYDHNIRYQTISDRKLAIQTAIKAARPGDSVIIAGKGHETYQIIGKEKVYFDDREVARQALDELPTL